LICIAHPIWEPPQKGAIKKPKTIEVFDVQYDFRYKMAKTLPEDEDG